MKQKDKQEQLDKLYDLRNKLQTELDTFNSILSTPCENYQKAFEDSCTSLKELLLDNSNIYSAELTKVLDILKTKLESLASSIDINITGLSNSLINAIASIVDNLLISIQHIQSEITKINVKLAIITADLVNIHIQIDNINDRIDHNPGPQGPKGDKGDPGVSIDNIWVA